MRIVSNGVHYIVQTGVDTDGETQEEDTTFRMKLDVSECQDCGDVKDESFSIMNGALDEKISSEQGLLWLASLSARVPGVTKRASEMEQGPEGIPCQRQVGREYGYPRVAGSERGEEGRHDMTSAR
ncbi:hypothetical protein DPX16_10386 [Anabarilius grahami]|uniref:Uncharacterized protein n=1 Tax=Anabarilius grahami TaxID=495550 RepID=A0A3N0Y556_ANAGA|nr:hypothetical protein DPX16_10386 [Anabarilius grahami]